MKSIDGKDDTTAVETAFLPRMGVGSLIIFALLMLLLVATGVIIYFGWTVGGNVALPASSYIAMALGVIFSLAVGFGLMALIFYSSRKGYDEPPVLIVPEVPLEKPKDRLETK
jgi:hypothetical protein